MKLLTKIKNLFKKDEEDNCIRTLHQAYKLGFQDGQLQGYAQGRTDKVDRLVCRISDLYVKRRG